MSNFAGQINWEISSKEYEEEAQCAQKGGQIKEVFRSCNVLPFSCTHLALWRGKEEGLKLWLAI